MTVYAIQTSIEYDQYRLHQDDQEKRPLKRQEAGSCVLRQIDFLARGRMARVIPNLEDVKAPIEANLAAKLSQRFQTAVLAMPMQPEHQSRGQHKLLAYMVFSQFYPIILSARSLM
jgi:hypothetical protein